MRIFVALLALLSVPSPAWAHQAPFSFLDLVLTGDSIEGILVLHVVDVAHDLGIESEDQLLEPGVAGQERDRIVGLVAPRFTLKDGARVLTPQWQDVEVMAERHGLLLRFQVPGERPGALEIQTAMFPYDPVHQTFVNVYEDSQLRQQMIFNAESEGRVYYSGTAQGVVAVMLTFIPSGVQHILIGPDHILFLVGLLLLGGTWQALVKIVTAFTIGHSVTLSLAALSIVMPPPQLIEPAIALSIVFVGADNLVRGSGRDLRAWVALVFGFVHGFGFANVLREFGLPPEALGWSLFSFNVGVEVGQLVIVSIVASALVMIQRRSRALGHGVAYVGSIVVMAAGAYWFVQRVFFPGST